jgi:selenocysteine lyase/cysteine desulfurase
MPDRYESGNHNAPGLVGLEAALAWIEDQTLEQLQRHEREVTARLLEGLGELHGVSVYGPAAAERVGVVSLNIEGLSPQDASTILDQEFGIEVRSGLHCAPLTHECLGTLPLGGTVRLSIGPFTTTEQIDAAIFAVGEIAATVG